MEFAWGMWVSRGNMKFAQGIWDSCGKPWIRVENLKIVRNFMGYHIIKSTPNPLEVIVCEESDRADLVYGHFLT